MCHICMTTNIFSKIIDKEVLKGLSRNNLILLNNVAVHTKKEIIKEYIKLKKDEDE